MYVFFNDPPTTDIYTLSLHDALPICLSCAPLLCRPHLHAPREDSLALAVDGSLAESYARRASEPGLEVPGIAGEDVDDAHVDRKSTRLNSSHANTSYAVFWLKKKMKN